MLVNPKYIYVMTSESLFFAHNRGSKLKMNTKKREPGKLPCSPSLLVKNGVAHIKSDRLCATLTF